MKIDTLAQEFKNAGLQLRTLEVDWKEDMLRVTKKLANIPPHKKRRLENPVPVQPGAAFASKESQMLGDASRRKLGPKASPGKSSDCKPFSSQNGL